MTVFILLVVLFILVPLGIITYILMVIFPKKEFFFVVIFARALLVLTLAPIKIKGNLPKDLLCGIVFNHSSSFWDYAACVAIMGYKKKWKVVVGTNLHKYPIFRHFLKRIGIGVDRNDFNSKAEAAQKMKDALSDGYSIAIFPEGTRMRSYQWDKVLLPFKNSIFTLADELKIPIVPIVFSFPLLYSSADKILPFSPRVIDATICEPIKDEENRVALRDKTHRVMKEILLQKRELLNL